MAGDVQAPTGEGSGPAQVQDGRLARILLPTKPWWHRRARHVHVWRDTGRQMFARRGPIDVTGFIDDRMANDLLYGFTLIDQACACGERRQQHLTGRVEG